MSTQWFYAQNGQQAGPVSQEQLQMMLSTGSLSPEDLVWTEGMAQWLPARTVPGLLPPGAVAGGYPAATPGTPAPGMYTQPLSYAPPPASGRPTSVTVIAIIGIILASFKLLGSLCGLIAMPFLSRQLAAQGQTMPLPMAWVIISALLGLVLYGLLMAASISALRLAPWARKGLLAFAALAIASNIVGTVIGFAVVSGNASTPGQMAISVVSTLAGLIYPVCVLVFMTRPRVVAAFEPGHDPL